MTKPSTSLYLSKGSFAKLATLAASRYYIQTRGIGAGKQPSVSQFIDAIGVGELVAIGPFARWCNILSALSKIAATADLLSDAEYGVMAAIRNQIERAANFDDDDV